MLYYYHAEHAATEIQEQGTMSSYQFAGTLFNSRRQAIRAMVEDYLTAQGTNDLDSAEVREALDNPAATADAMITDGWNTIGLTGEYSDSGELESEEVSRADIIDALAF